MIDLDVSDEYVLKWYEREFGKAPEPIGGHSATDVAHEAWTNKWYASKAS